jgi:hypothetical protein
MSPPKLLPMTAHGDLALLGVSRNRLVEISGPEGHYSELPVAELSAGRLVDVEEVEIAAIEKRRSRAARQLWSGRDMVEVRAPDDIRSQVQ